MSFIPLISSPKNILLSQRTMIYFLIQSMSSLIFITFILVNKYIFLWKREYILKIIIVLIMIMKIGIPPFHIWFPEVINKIKWPICLLLITWQKLAPIYIVSITININKTTITIICVSAIMGAIGGINQTSTRKIIAYSSMNHIRWIFSCAAIFKKSWIIYIILYSIIIIIISFTINSYNIIFINQVNIISIKNIEKIIIISLIIRVGGLPPFLGFLPKWITIQYIISSKELLIIVIIIFSALITLVYYIRISTAINLIIGHSQKWINHFPTKKNLSKITIIINLIFPIFILFINLI